jgi:DNA mismatch repair protein MutH
MKKDVWTVQEIRQQAQSLVGKTIKEIQSSYAISSKVKGSIGQIIEDGAFSYSPNSNKGPDFEEAGVELKVTPFVRLKNGQCSAKERLVLNIINYMEEVRYEFETSSFWTKNKSIEIIFYEYQKELHPEDYRIEFEHLHEFSTKDLLIIRADWETIVNKIRDGLAHELSEGDTLFGCLYQGSKSSKFTTTTLLRCSRNATSFSLKTTYMTKLLRNEVCRKGIEKEELIKESELLNKRFEDIIRDKILAFKNRSVKELMTIYGVQSDSKSNLVLLTGKLLGIEGRINNTEEFQKANIEIKTIRLNLKNKIKESMSFPTFKYEDIVQEEWETSTLRQRFEETKYLFVVFKEQLNGDYVIADAMFWNMKPSDLDGDVQSVWQDTIK